MARKSRKRPTDGTAEGRAETLGSPADAAKIRSAYYGTGPLSGFGGPVSEKAALGVASFFWAVTFIAAMRSSLRTVIQERIGNSDQWETQHTHATAWLLNFQPNPNRTARSIHHERFLHLLTSGRSLSILRINPFDGEPAAIWPIHPSGWGPPEDTASGRFFTANLASGVERLDVSQVLDLIAATTDGGLTTLSPLRLFERQLSLAGGLTSHAEGFWNNNPRPGLIIESEEGLSDEQFAQLQARLNAGYSRENAGKALILEGGLKGTPWQMTFADYQLLEMLSMLDEQIGRRVFNMPPDTLKDDAWSRYFVDFTLRPWIELDDQELTVKLTPYSTRGRFRCVTQMNDLNRGDLKSRADIAQRSILSAIATRNEARGLIDLPPVPGGDVIREAQSIFGAPKGSVTGGDQPTTSPNSRTGLDPAAADQLLGDAIGSIFSRTKHALDKLDAPDAWRLRFVNHFTDQRSLVEQKLRMIGPEGRSKVLAEIESHESELRSLDESGPTDRSARLAAWSGQVASRIPELVHQITRKF